MGRACVLMIAGSVPVGGNCAFVMCECVPACVRMWLGEYAVAALLWSGVASMAAYVRLCVCGRCECARG